MKNKIVINTCYGGFRLSVTALQRYWELKHGEQTYLYDYCFASKVYIKTVYNEEALVVNKDFGNEVPFLSEEFNKSIVNSETIPRHDPILVQVVEELGKEANGFYANLEVVEIEGSIYQIDEHDGYESVIIPEQHWIKIEENDHQIKNLLSLVADAIATNTVEEAIEYLEDTMSENETLTELQEHVINILTTKLSSI